jgi:predicted Zn-dependent protease
MAFLFTGCATSTTSTRTPAKVEDRAASPQTAAPAKAPEQAAVKVYKMEEPRYVVPESLPDATIEERMAELPPADSTNLQSMEQKSSPAVVALLDDSDKYATTGKKQEAVASIERALRIEPKNPLLWHKLGQLRLQESNWDQAIAMAKKSSVLAPGNRLLRSENWMLIARAKEGQGDTAGALQALDMAQQLRTY